MRKDNNSSNLIRVIKNLYDKAIISAVLFNSSMVPNNSWSPTGVCALTHPLQHNSGKDHDRRLRRSRRLCQQFSINGSAGEEEELAKLGERLDKASIASDLEISAENTKLMTNNTSGISS